MEQPTQPGQNLPTLSPQSNRLIELCEAVMTGQTDAEQLIGLLDEMNQGLDKAREDFITQANQQGERYLEQMQEEMKLVLESFDEYQAGLDEISLYLQGRNVQHIKNGVAVIVEATNHILDFLTVYEAKSLQMGPTSFPILNMLILLTDTFKKGEVQEDELRFMIYNASQFFSKILDELEGYEGEEAVSSIELLKEGYGKFMEGLDKLDEGVQDNNELIIDDALEIIRVSQQIMRDGYTKFGDEMFLDKPTKSKWSNMIINTIDGFKKNIFPQDVLMENLTKYQEEMRSLRINIEGLLSVPHDNPSIDDEAPRTEQALDLIDEGIDEVKMFFQDNNMAHFDAAVKKITEGTALLQESKEVYDDIGEREGKVGCLRCGHLNEPTANSCVKCNAMLPKVISGMQSTFQVGEAGQIDSGREQEFVMTENVKKIVDACASVRDGLITFEEFDKTLKWMENNVAIQENMLATGQTTINVDAFAPEDRELALHQKELVDDTMELLREGIEDVKSGVAALRLFISDEDVEHLRAGLEMIVEGSIKVHKVEKVCELAEREIAKIEAGRVDESATEADYPEEAPEIDYSDKVDSSLLG